MSLSEYKQLIDSALPTFLPKADGYADKLFEAMSYSALAPGKRLRPALCMIGAKLSGASGKVALPFACSIEMIHAYSLIHDDLPCMDDDNLRRGRPTCHKVYGEAIALLAGDGLLSHAFETMLAASVQLCESDNERANCLRAAAYIAKCAGSGGMIAGQTADMDHSGGTETLLFYIQKNKTSKLLMASIISGLMLGGADAKMVNDFETFASCFGAAFQITDDILDVIGDESVLGKPIGSDEEQNKLTAVSLWGLDGAKRRASEYVEMAKSAIEGYEGAKELAALADSLLSRRS